MLAEPHRRQILDLLRDDSARRQRARARARHQPAERVEAPAGAREAGLVAVRTDAQRRLYRLRPEPFREIDEWLATVTVAWSKRLSKLERHLDEMED